MTRTDIINKIIKERGYKSYLEIGTRDKKYNFNNIECQEKLCIDPYPEGVVDLKMTSDEFFKVNGKKFDIIFIDGLHEGHQVYRDIMNSLDALNEGGVIVCHDCMPETNEAQKGFEEYAGKETWNGDSWKGFLKYRLIGRWKAYVVTEDEGCGIIDTQRESDVENKLIVNINELTWKDYDQNRNLFDFREDILL